MVALAVSCGSVSNPDLQSQLSPLAAEIDNIGTQLPALDGLPQPPKASSLLGPGWFSIPILEQGVILEATDAVLKTPEGIEFAAGDIAHHAIFGVSDFDGDSFPSSLRVEIGAGKGPYYVGVSRFESGRWEFAGPFSGDAQIEYEDVTKSSHPLLFVSGRGRHYVAIVTESGKALTLTGLQLGVDGGSQAPLTQETVSARSGVPGIQLYWNNSADALRPDFAGYAVERALWPGTAYQQIRPPMQQTHFLDTAVETGISYRYRLRLQDSSGNSSWSFSTFINHLPGDLPPVPLIQFPRGPLYGAQNVSFDMSDSFDPDGDSITDYRLSFDFESLRSGILTSVGTDNVREFFLQPGCYLVQLRVTANGQSSRSHAQLKIYPAWQSSPQLVSAADALDWRMQDSRSIYYPQQDAVVTVFNDLLVPGIGLLMQKRDGSTELFQLQQYENRISSISELTIWNGMVCFAALESSLSKVGFFDGTRLDWMYGPSEGIYTESIDLLVDGNNDLRICYMRQFNPTDWEIVAMNCAQIMDTYSLVPVTHAKGQIDAEWNAQTGTIDIVYPDLGSCRFSRYLPLSGPVLDVPIYPMEHGDVDLEINPADGTPGILLRLGIYPGYTQFDNAALTLSSLEQMTSSSMNVETLDLAFVDSDATAFIGSAVGRSGLFRRNGGAWDETSASWTVQSGMHCSLAVWPDDSLRIVDGDSEYLTHLIDISPADAIIPAGSLPGTAYQGNDLSVVAGVDGLHAYWNTSNFTRHYLGDSSGTTWNRVADIGYSEGLDLMADRDGIVWLSSTAVGVSYLERWNGTGFDNLAFVPNALPTLPWLCMQQNAHGVQWWEQDFTAGPTKLTRVHDDDGLGIVISSTTLADLYIMEGCGLWNGTRASSLVLAINGLTNRKRVGFIDNNDSHFSQVLDSEIDASYGQLADGRLLDCAMGKTPEPWYQEVYWVARAGIENRAMRIQGTTTEDGFLLNNLTSLPEPALERLTGKLKTVSASQAWGLTAVGLVDQYYGPHAYLEWDDFGGFEELPLPPIDFGSSNMHELVVANNGRWHILYHDRRDGGIYLISTT